ncbi:lymphocyte antigen 6D [Oryctolagus cuniculus]|uniref:lymphocyte antigen 6D n=1 Tax=Oryctolagus cuniculus TaxID=9986 RepID=UPI003879A268
MKTVLLLLVALAVATAPALALRCHVCSSTTNCKQPQPCSSSARYCRTMTRVEPLSGNLVTKDCVESCTASHTMQGQVSSGTTATYCCQGDLCNERLNSAAPGRAWHGSALLGPTLALGLLALLWAPNL